MIYCYFTTRLFYRHRSRNGPQDQDQPVPDQHVPAPTLDAQSEELEGSVQADGDEEYEAFLDSINREIEMDMQVIINLLNIKTLIFILLLLMHLFMF